MQPRKGFLVWLGGLSVLGFLATDMYLPAFAAMQEDLQTPAAAISASLSLFLAGFAFAQLLWGPLSDRFGRKPVLLLGLAIFSVGCLGMLWVRDATWLLVLRFVQAVGVCAAAVTWQALVTDYYPANRTNRIFATIMPLVGLSPALAPLLGSWILAHFDWQAIFATLFAITLVLMLPAFALKPAHKKRGACRRDADYLHLPAERQSVSRECPDLCRLFGQLLRVAHRLAVYSARYGLQPGGHRSELCSADHRVPGGRVRLPRGAAKMGRSADAALAAGALCAERHRHLGRRVYSGRGPG